MITVCTALAGWLPAAAVAAEYSLESTLSVNSELRDRKFEGSDSTELVETNIYPEFEFKRATGVSDFTATLDFHIRRFDEEHFDSDEYALDLGYAREFERFNYSVATLISRKSTFIEDEEGLDTAQNTSSALDEDRQGLYGRLGYQLTESQSLSFSAGATNREYEQSDRFDSVSYNAELRYNYRVSERFHWLLSTTWLDFDSDDDGFELNEGGYIEALQDNFGVGPGHPLFLDNFLGIAAFCFQQEDFAGSSITILVDVVPCYTGVKNESNSQVFAYRTGFSYRIGENFDLEVLAGQEKISIERIVDYAIDANTDIDIDTDTTEATYEANLGYRQLNTNYQFSAIRATVAQSDGAVELSESVRFSVSRRLSERNAIRFGLRWFAEESDSNIFSTDIERYEGEVQFSRRFNSAWNGRVRYRYYEEEFGSEVESRQHAVLFTVEWDPQPKVWRR